MSATKFTGTHKECSRCRELLPLVRFGTASGPKAAKHGYRSKCRECESAVKREYDRSRGVKEMPKTVLTKDRKSCTICGLLLPHDRFGKNPTAKHGLAAACFSCKRDASFQKLYGITLDDYAVMLRNQHYRCAICRALDYHENGGQPLFVDHDHKTGRVRGLLCHYCNAGIGHFKDVSDLMRFAADYLDGVEY